MALCGHFAHPSTDPTNAASKQQGTCDKKRKEAGNLGEPGCRPRGPGVRSGLRITSEERGDNKRIVGAFSATILGLGSLTMSLSCLPVIKINEKNEEDCTTVDNSFSFILGK
jgi:hypothetical protein